MSERGVYVTVFALTVLVAAAGGYAIWWGLRFDVSPRLITALGIATFGNALVGYRAWNAAQGVRPVEGDRVSLVLKVVSVAIFVLLFGPHLWSIVRR